MREEVKDIIHRVDPGKPTALALERYMLRRRNVKAAIQAGASCYYVTWEELPPPRRINPRRFYRHLQLQVSYKTLRVVEAYANDNGDGIHVPYFKDWTLEDLVLFLVTEPIIKEFDTTKEP